MKMLLFGSAVFVFFFVGGVSRKTDKAYKLTRFFVL